MEMERDEIAVKSRFALITTQCETLNKSDAVRDDAESRTKEDDQVQSEVVQTEESCNLTNSKICLQSSKQTNLSLTSDEIYPQSSHVSLI